MRHDRCSHCGTARPRGTDCPECGQPSFWGVYKNEAAKNPDHPASWWSQEVGPILYFAELVWPERKLHGQVEAGIGIGRRPYEELLHCAKWGGSSDVSRVGDLAKAEIIRREMMDS